MSRVNVDAIAFSDLRFARLAQLLGLADADHAIGKCARIWWECTKLGTAELPQWVIDAHLGSGGTAALIDAQLARFARGRGDSKTRLVHVCGANERCLWLANKQGQSSKGGKTRAQSAQRAAGRFTSQSTSQGTSYRPAADQPNTSPPAPAPAPAPAPEDPERETLRARSHATGTGPHPVQPSALPDLPPLGPEPPDPRLLRSPSRLTDSDLQLRARQELRVRTVNRLSDLRMQLAADLGLSGVRPLHPQDPGERELANRIVESGSDASANVDHVLTVAEILTRGDGGMSRLTGALWQEKSWRFLLGTSPDEARRRGAKSAGADEQPRYRAPVLDEEDAS